MAKRKFSLRGWLLGAFILALVLVGGNILLYRYLLDQAGGQKNLLSLFSFLKTTPLTLPSQPAVPKETGQWRVAIIIDDLGYKQWIAHELAAISPQLTLSVFPHLPYSKSIARQAAQNGQEVLLHLPMEPEDAGKLSPPQPGMLLLRMSPSQMRRQLRRQLQELPSVVGVNNHMGSLFTADKAAMELILGELRWHKLFFLDSFTSGKSIAYTTARGLGMPALRRDIFLDNQLERKYILQQLGELAKLAKRQGQAIGIGHPHALTLQVLREFLPQLQKQGIELVSVSRLLKIPSPQWGEGQGEGG